MRQFIEREIYHVFNKSIAGYPIFKDLDNSQRFLEGLYYYNNQLAVQSYSRFLEKHEDYQGGNLLIPITDGYVKFLAYCIMPDHYHLLIKITKDNSLSKLISDIENSFTRFFNIKFKRVGPLWQTCFKSVQIISNEQLLHVSRYIHLNPVTNFLVDKPEDWIFSSYKTIISKPIFLDKYVKEISIDNIQQYKKFTENNIDYQRRLKLIKKLMLD